MSVGDLVQLNPIYFDLHDEVVGIVVDLEYMVDTQESVKMVKVVWLDDSNGPEVGWYDINELEVLSGSR
jgi:hypothetical protein